MVDFDKKCLHLTFSNGQQVSLHPGGYAEVRATQIGYADMVFSDADALVGFLSEVSDKEASKQKLLARKLKDKLTKEEFLLLAELMDEPPAGLLFEAVTEIAKELDPESYS